MVKKSLLYLMLVLGSMALMTTTQIERVPIIAENAAMVTQLEVLEVEGVSQPIWSPNGQTLAVNGLDGALLFDSGFYEEPAALLSNEGKVFFTVDGELMLLATLEGIEVRAIDREEHLAFLEHPWLTDLAISSDGSTIASVSADLGTSGSLNQFKLWNVENFSLLETIDTSPNQIMSIVFVPQSAIVVSGDTEGLIQVWDIELGSILESFQGHDDLIADIEIHESRNLLASGSKDGTVKLWEVATWNQVGVLETDLSGLLVGEILDLAFNHDGSILASSYENGEIRLWDVESGTQLQTLVGHDYEARGIGFRFGGIAFSPDGTLLVSSGWDDTIRFWGISEAD